MQSACLSERVETRAQVEVISVAQNNLRLYLLTQLGEVYTLDAAHRTYRHEDGRLNLTMIGRNQSCAGVAGCISMLQFKRHFFSSSSGISKGMGFFTISLVRAKSHTS